MLVNCVFFWETIKLHIDAVLTWAFSLGSFLSFVRGRASPISGSSRRRRSRSPQIRWPFVQIFFDFLVVREVCSVRPVVQILAPVSLPGSLVWFLSVPGCGLRPLVLIGSGGFFISSVFRLVALVLFVAGLNDIDWTSDALSLQQTLAKF